MAILSGVITVCVVTLGPAKVQCHHEPFKTSRAYGMVLCEDILALEMQKMREKISRQLKPGEMLTMNGQCFPVDWDERRDHT